MKVSKWINHLADLVKKIVSRSDSQKINKIFNEKIKCFPDASFNQMIAIASNYVDDRTEPLIIMAIAHIIRILEHGVDGVVNLVGFQ